LLLAGSTPIPAAVSLDTSLEIVTVNPNANLTSSTTYTLIVSTGVKDLAGNAMQTASITSFTTS